MEYINSLESFKTAEKVAGKKNKCSILEKPENAIELIQGVILSKGQSDADHAEKLTRAWNKASR